MEIALTNPTKYWALILALAVASGCSHKMTTTRARLVDRRISATEASPVEISARSQKSFNNGLSLFRAGEDEAAQRDFAEAVAADSSNWQAHYYLGLIHKKHAARSAAVASLHAALTHAPEHRQDRSLIYVALGELFEEQQEFSRAQLSYRMALNLYPGSTRATAGLHRVELLVQRIEK